MTRALLQIAIATFASFIASPAFSQSGGPSPSQSPIYVSFSPTPLPSTLPSASPSPLFTPLLSPSPSVSDYVVTGPLGPIESECEPGTVPAMALYAFGDAMEEECETPGNDDGYGGAWWQAETLYNGRKATANTMCTAIDGVAIWDTNPTYIPGYHDCEERTTNGITYQYSAKKNQGVCCTVGEIPPQQEPVVSADANIVCMVYAGEEYRATMYSSIFGYGSDASCTTAKAESAADLITQRDAKRAACLGTPGSKFVVTVPIVPARCVEPEWMHKTFQDVFCCKIPD
jgi:hypothetical protein